MGRISIEIDDKLIGRIMKRYRFRTKREAVEYALRQLDVKPMTRDETPAMRGTGWDGDLDEMRAGCLIPDS